MHCRLASFEFTARTIAPSAMVDRGLSRFPCEELACVLGVLDRAGPVDLSRYQGVPYCLPLALTASASWMRTVSRLNIPAHMPPVNAWPAPLRTHTHHSGPMWIATPSSYETFTHCHLAGFHRRTNAWPHAPSHRHWFLWTEKKKSSNIFSVVSKLQPKSLKSGTPKWSPPTDISL
jgi:hypothetical protein